MVPVLLTLVGQNFLSGRVKGGRRGKNRPCMKFSNQFLRQGAGVLMAWNPGIFEEDGVQTKNVWGKGGGGRGGGGGFFFL